ncbi:hypothetical protein VTN77DRAFT_8560 [Rasamsonia byssochlamydoides]|uniref:uncharacterized protein n=1 Tax=Rasamsonia byssochlamydoides TaxID=89139 RepID=UPI0037438947
MSPARVLEPTEKDQQLQTLARALDALLLTAQQLSLKEQDLQRRVKYAHDEYVKLANRVDGGSTSEEDAISQKILHGDSESSSRLDSLNPLDVVNHLRDSGHVGGRLLEAITAGVKCAKTITELRNGNDLNVRSNPCLVAANARRSSASERDFTTNGVRGSLQCPFAKTADKTESTNGTRDDRNTNATSMCEYDPFKAELGQDRLSSNGVPARSSVARCPIRYLDQHSPEEVAQYFENHKHEIPRSHAVCVKRYQRDTGSIDAKYGSSLVDMIKGLGQKHKPFLPNPVRNGAPATTSTSAERVEKWAEDVSSKSPHPGTLTTVEEDTAKEPSDRTSRFERPLREVRVGESPSRPWGIPIPISHQPPPSAGNSPVAPVQVPASNGLPEIKQPTGSDTPVAPPHDGSPTPARPPGRCPFDHEALQQPDRSQNGDQPFPNLERKPSNAGGTFKNPGSDLPPSLETTKPSPSSPAQMVFNGPVFFGYSAEQAAALMQQLASRGVVN